MTNKITSKPRLLTGDTPTGKLHLGHWVGSVENRVKLQDEYECYYLLANIHAFTTRADRPAEIRQSVLDITVDYLAAGIDPRKSVIFIESDVPAIYTLASIFSMLIPFPRLMRNPTLKDEIRDKKLGDNYSFGFLLYAVLQVADILAFQAEVVPVGEDQLPHLEMTREVARRFNQMYCGVDPHTEDADYLRAGGILPIITPLVGRVDRLVGLGPPNAEGRLLKMSKSLDNAILLSDDADTVAKKVMSMYTDPNRLRASDPGTVENNPLWIFHDIFNPDKAWVAQTKELYRAGQVGDVTCKKKLIEVLNELLEPIRQRRLLFHDDLAQVLQILRDGAERANAVAERTLSLVKKSIHQDF
jgi:tryptophanyl-tRNA synthetase